MARAVPARRIERLVLLTRGNKSRSERQRRTGEVAYDFIWMWDGLGLQRE